MEKERRTGYFALFLSFILLSCSARQTNLPDSELTRFHEESAISTLRTIQVACVTYLRTYNTFPHALADLGPSQHPLSPRQIRPHFNDAPQFDSHHAGLIDGATALGHAMGYIIIYMPGPPARRGTIQTFSVSARPWLYARAGRRSFYTDQTGLIRSTDEDRPATDNDPFVTSK